MGLNVRTLIKREEGNQIFSKNLLKDKIMNTTTFGISFLIRKCKADKKRADIYARITIDGDGKELSTKEQISLSSWDSAKSRVKGNSIEVKSIKQNNYQVS